MTPMDEQFYTAVEQIYQQDSRYHPEAYAFVMEALSFSQKKFKKERHVSGEELLEGIKALTLKNFGPLSMTVLHYWGVTSTNDFGHIVSNLVKHHILAQDSKDSFESFNNAYDFHEVFDRGYRKQLARRLKSMRF